MIAILSYCCHTVACGGGRDATILQIGSMEREDIMDAVFECRLEEQRLHKDFWNLEVALNLCP